MNVDVTVDLDGDTLVAIKTASGAQGVDRMHREAERLADARHPGVVALVACRDLDPAVAAGGGSGEPVCELRTAYAGEPLTRWTGSVADVGGVAAAVASTLADLHDAGVVHGRLDASHVLLGDGGRPRLCGLSGPDGATAPDDVAAWGRLVDDLLVRAPSPRRGFRAAARGGHGARRALLALVDSATDPVPTRRPTARALADAVMTAVPTATLPAAGASTTLGRGRVGARLGATARPEGDTLDRIWSYAGEPSEDERWAAAFGTAPDDGPGPADLPLAHVDALEWSGPAAGDHDRADPGADLDDPTGPDDDRTRDHVPVGARPRARTAAPDVESPRRRSRLAAVATAGIVIAAGLGLTLLLAGGPGGDADAPRPAADRAGCGPVAPPAADVDGDGCREPLVVAGSTVDAGIARWSLGEPGDVVTVGDWDCDGEASPALLRPASGDVFLFATWAELDRPVTVTPAQRVAGGAGIRAEPAGTGDRPCDRLVVDLQGGGVTTVAVPG